MKIPAHLLSPAPTNGKGAQNAPVQSVADFINEQSGASKDFFSAMKSLQGLAKSQPTVGPKTGSGKDAASVSNNSVATKFAELKFAEPRNEGLEQQEPGPGGSQEVLPPSDEQPAKREQVQIGGKVPVSEAPVSLAKEVKAAEALADVNTNEQASTKLDEIRSEIKPSAIQSLEHVKEPATKSAGTEAISNLSQQNQASTSTSIAPKQAAPAVDPIGQKLAELASSNMARSDEGFKLAAQSNPTLSSMEKDQRRNIEARSIGDSASKNPTRPLDTALIPSKQVATKGETKSDLPLALQSQREELPPLFKPTANNGVGVQQQAELVPQATMTNLQAAQTPAPASAKEITAQVTRHLNSELLNMDLRTQVVAERAMGYAPNTSVLTLQLHPIGLGRIQADIRKEGELLRIKLTVEAKGTFDLLKNDIDVLKTAMRALGTAEGDVMLTQGNINRLTNDVANNGQNFFANERDGQSELRERQDGGSNDHSGQQSADSDTAPWAKDLDPALQDSVNVVTI